MSEKPLSNRTILVTGSGRRIGNALARACANAGADLIIHYHNSNEQAEKLRNEVVSAGQRAHLVQADIATPEGVSKLVGSLASAKNLFGLVNSAAIFETMSMQDTTITDWEQHMAINLSAPFLLSQAFAKQLPDDATGAIVNILDWRAMRPGADHFPYTISKAALASLTKASAVALAPRISVNGLALGAILPPSDKPASPNILKDIPMGRWGELAEVESALIYLLTGPAYITGEIIHVDGGRHLI